MLRRYVVLAACCVAGLVPAGSGAASHAARPSRCALEHLKCFHVSVPLDWSGARAGKVSLKVEEHVAPGTPRGVMFLLAGGPDQASTDEFYLGQGSFWQRTFPGYTLVTFDPRGTGGSEPLECPSGAAGSTSAEKIADCALHLGAARDYYRTTDNAADIDGVRRALGVGRVAVYGVSYGTDVALTYARLFPTHVERLILDSVATPLTGSTLISEVVDDLPAKLQALCARRCAGPTRSFAADAVSLANSLATEPLQGRVLQADGTRRLVQLGAGNFLGLLIGSDLSPGVAAELPAADAAARGGDPLPLLRIYEVTEPPTNTRATDPVYWATVCGDGPFPWQPDTPVAERPALLESALAEVPAGTYGQFGSWAAKLDNAYGCIDWPPSAAPAPTVPAAYPDIPVLAVSGALDHRSPTFEARAALARFPRGELLTVPNTGHAALADSQSPCLSAAVRRWLGGHPLLPHPCRAALPLAPIPAFPTTQARPSGPAETLALALGTIREAEAVSGLVPDQGAIAGVRSGILTQSEVAFNLSRYSDTAGIFVSGRLHSDTPSDHPWSFAGTVRIEGPSGAVSSLALNTDGLSGDLDGMRVVESRLAGPEPPVQVMRPARAWSAWRPPSGTAAATARAIAGHVGGGYLLDAAGQRLVTVTAAAARSPKGWLGRPISALAIRKGFDLPDYRFSETSHTWTYALCGRGPRCSIPGKPTLARYRLITREGLELALYTFEFDPGVDAVAVFIPSARGSTTTALLYFTRSELTAQLTRPLARTLTLATPPLPTVSDPVESSTIAGLTDRRNYVYQATRLEDGSLELFLDH